MERKRRGKVRVEEKWIWIMGGIKDKRGTGGKVGIVRERMRGREG